MLFPWLSVPAASIDSQPPHVPDPAPIAEMAPLPLSVALPDVAVSHIQPPSPESSPVQAPSAWMAFVTVSDAQLMLMKPPLQLGDTPSALTSPPEMVHAPAAFTTARPPFLTSMLPVDRVFTNGSPLPDVLSVTDPACDRMVPVMSKECADSVTAQPSAAETR